MDQIQNKVNEVATALEQAVDEELERLDKLTVSDYENLREERLKALKKREEQRRNWLGQVSVITKNLFEYNNNYELFRVMVHIPNYQKKNLSLM